MPCGPAQYPRYFSDNCRLLFIQVLPGRHLIEPPPPEITATIAPKKPPFKVFHPLVPVRTKVSYLRRNSRSARKERILAVFENQMKTNECLQRTSPPRIVCPRASRVI